MKLSHGSKYAVQALAFLATQNEDQMVASQHIAGADGTPEKLVLKLLGALERARIVVSLKGPRGGYRLARPAAAISMLNIIEAIEGPMRGWVPSGISDNAQFDKRLAVIYDRVTAEARARLEQTSIADLAGKGGKKR
jgi:Rrf2 family protein